MIRRTAICSFCAFLSGCFAAAARIAGDDLSNIKTVGVVSLIGDHFYAEQRYGLFEWQSRHLELPVGPDWRLDEVAEVAVKEALEGGRKLRVIRMNHDAGLYKLYTDSIVRPVDFNVIEKELRALVAAQPVDVLLLVTKRTDGPQGRLGSGPVLYAERLPLKGLVQFATYDLCSVTVLSGSSLAPIASRPCAATRKDIDKALYDEDLNKLTDQARQTIGATLQDQLRSTMTCTVEDFGFTVTPPCRPVLEPGWRR